ncbi:MAG: hypothetical protein V2A73_02005 [Pseudomonadota bacterium]
MKRLLLSLFVAGLLGCGGSEAVAPKPLGFVLEDLHIASVALEEKQAVLQSKQEWDVAQMERAKVEADYEEHQVRVEIARNQCEQAVLAEKSAQAEKRAADRSGNLTRVNSAERGLRAAELGRRTADAKLGFLQTKGNWLVKQIRYHQFNALAREAKHQLEKARLAQSKNIRPAGFAFANFESQYRERSETAQRIKMESEREKQLTKAKRQDWNRAEREYLATKGAKDAPESESETF